ncbi:hypothetical protein ACFPYI_13735 [Halomarina salina]|uniref:Uncharacterized protein n=1 Tax=Halomarina salina TaxID=1872699 RepID=A0ABD5RP13_9EURY|nr:hypothetical protein [Halomarina salina]
MSNVEGEVMQVVAPEQVDDYQFTRLMRGAMEAGMCAVVIQRQHGRCPDSVTRVLEFLNVRTLTRESSYVLFPESECPSEGDWVSCEVEPAVCRARISERMLVPVGTGVIDSTDRGDDDE